MFEVSYVREDGIVAEVDDDEDSIEAVVDIFEEKLEWLLLLVVVDCT